MKHFPVVIFGILLGFCIGAFGQQTIAAPGSQGQHCCEALQQQIRELQERVIALEGQVRTLKQAEAALPPPPPAALPQIATATPEPSAQTAGAAAGGTPPSQLPAYGGASALAKALNPDISIIGDFLGSAGGNSIPEAASLTPFRSLEMREAELSLRAIVDPYARGDFFLSFGEEGVELEEGYISFTALPAGFTAKAGKMRAAFGKVNTMHNHMLPWTDRPLVTDNLLGGEDGINDAGLSVTRILPAPKGLFLEATGQLFRGDSGESPHPLFVSSRKSDVSAVAHLRGYKDLTESTNLDIGFSFARGHNDLGTDFLTRLYGLDATLRWKPLRRSIYRSFTARSEFVWSQRQQTSPSVLRAFGYYGSADYQLSRRWFVGGRYDSSQRALLAGTDRGASAVLTFWPSEFAQLRGQYRFTRFAERVSGSELLMQLQFVLGAHGAHPF